MVVVEVFAEGLDEGDESLATRARDAVEEEPNGVGGAVGGWRLDEGTIEAGQHLLPFTPTGLLRRRRRYPRHTEGNIGGK